MKKLLVVLVVGFIVATAASYFGMQWKVRKSVDDFFAALFFVDASYEKAQIDLNGQIILNNIELFVPSSQTTVEIGRIAIGTGGFFNTLGLEKTIKDGKLPEQVELKISSFSVDIDPQFINQLDDVYEPGTFEQVLALGCGRYLGMGPKQIFDMGLRTLTFDLNLGYTFNAPADEFVSSFELYMDGIGHLILDQSYLGLASIMQNYKSALGGFDPTSVVPTNLELQYVDLGYNTKVHDFCAKAAEMDKPEWLELNRSMFSAVLNEIDFDADFDVIKLYTDLFDARSRLNLKMRPLPNFGMADLEFYGIAELVELLDLHVIVNNESVGIGRLSWDQSKLSQLDLTEIRKTFRVGPEPVEAEEEQVEAKELERILKPVPVSDLAQYLHRDVLLERKDGKTFAGELWSVSSTRVVVRTRLRSGYTDLPLVRSEIAIAKLYPEP